MLDINGTEYRLVGLDTNVLSQILRDGDAARAGLFALFGEGYVPCFSVYSLFELRKRREIFDSFVEFFDVVPCMILKNQDQLLEDERERYPDSRGIDPTLLGFSHLNTSRRTNLRSLMEVSFRDPDTLSREAAWPGLKQELLAGWLELKSNYPPRGRRHIPPEGIPFVNRVVRQQLEEREPEWLSTTLAAGDSFIPAAFPSLRMTLWTVFFRVYMADRRTPETQDVFDALIANPAPYLDAVVTENFQADIYRQVMRMEKSIAHLDVLTLKDLRGRAA